MKTPLKTLATILSLALASVAQAGDLVVVSVVSPSVIVLGSKSTTAVTVHAEVKRSEVIADTVRLNGIRARSVFADSCGDLVAKFDIGLVKAIVEPPSATLTLTAELTSGGELTGTDTVPVR